MEFEKQIKILKIVNIALVILMIIVAYLVILKASTLGHSPTTTGKLIYLDDISDPENPQVGVYLKLILEYPKYASFGEEGNVGFFEIANTTNVIGIVLKNITGNEKTGFVVDVKDKNNNSVVDTGDVFHIYGRPLKGYVIMFCITGISGNIHYQIPQK